jgi:2-methylaconitate cis-trans-isomerase PrpF
VLRNPNKNRAKVTAVLVVAVAAAAAGVVVVVVMVVMSLAVKVAFHHQTWNLRVTVHLVLMNSHQVLLGHARKVMPQVVKMQFNPPCVSFRVN